MGVLSVLGGGINQTFEKEEKRGAGRAHLGLGRRPSTPQGGGGDGGGSGGGGRAGAETPRNFGSVLAQRDDERAALAVLGRRSAVRRSHLQSASLVATRQISLSLSLSLSLSGKSQRNLETERRDTGVPPFGAAARRALRVCTCDLVRVDEEEDPPFACVCVRVTALESRRRRPAFVDFAYDERELFSKMEDAVEDRPGDVVFGLGLGARHAVEEVHRFSRESTACAKRARDH